MSFLADVETVIQSRFNGSLIRLDSYSVPQGNALYAQNCNYLKAQVGTRTGHSQVFNVNSGDGPTTSLMNWLFVFAHYPIPVQPISVAMYYAPAVGARGWVQNPAGYTALIFPITGAAGASMVGAGERLYGAFYNATGKASYGNTQGQVYSWNVGTDSLFPPPLQFVPSFAEPSAGVVTAGLHRFGYLFTTRSGYTGKLSPVDSSTVFAPASFTAAGGKNLQVTIAGTLPSYMSGTNTIIQVVMTTVANPNQYFTVPGALATPATNSNVITVNISDDDLAATGTDVTEYMNLLTQTVGGVGPFYPSALSTYSSRMAYVTIDGAGVPVVYFSNQNAYQYVTADQHGIYLEGNAQPVQCFSLRGVCYIGTQYAFYSVEDSGDVPVNWTPPQKVDGSIGILSPTCITVNPSLGYAGIVSDRGFYIFQGGIFPALPLSYYQQPDWGRINWMVPTQVQVVDDQLNKRFLVSAPLGCTVAAVSGTGPYTVTTNISSHLPSGISLSSGSAPHLYQTGLQVTIDGVTGIQTITVIASNQFTIPGGSGAPTVGGKILPLTATARMTWDYTDGDTPETVKYSLDAFSKYNVGAMTTVQNVTTALQEVWFTPSVQGVGIRQNDGTEALPYRDVDSTGDPTSYEWLYETSLFPGAIEQAMVPPSTLHQFCGAHLRVAGSGQLKLTAYGLDHVITIVPAASPMTLSQFPGKEYLVKWALMSEQQSIQFGQTVFDTNAFLNLIRAYYTEYAPQR